jgi:hypothetical protein
LTAQTIVLNHPVAFTAPNGNPVVAPSGPYHLAPAGTSDLRLLSARGPEAFIVQAITIKHSMRLAEPIALATAGNGSAFHIVLLYPDGHGIEATGTTDVVRGRGTTGAAGPAVQPLTEDALSAAVERRLQRMR